VALNLLTRDPERRHRRLARLTLNRVDLREPFIKLCLQLERERPVAPATVQAQFDAATNWRSPSALQVPSLFLVGGRDRLVHRDCMRALAGRYAAPLEEHPDAGHDLTTDAHDWVAEHLARFRERIAARS
jgi:pimeloyl-ACP methyl ester carboxylesterase